MFKILFSFIKVVQRDRDFTLEFLNLILGRKKTTKQNSFLSISDHFREEVISDL